MRKINFILATLFLLHVMLSASDTCLINIQKLRDNYSDKHYTSLLFDADIESESEKAKREILRKISLQIQSTVKGYIKSETSSINNKELKKRVERNFTQDIKKSVLNIDIETLLQKRYSCKSLDENFVLYTVNREDVFNKAQKELKTLSKKNKELFLEIQTCDNPLKKALLYEKIRANYLPYLMILETFEKDKERKEFYFKETRAYERAYIDFLENILFFVDIKYPYNRFYPVEERVDEVRQDIVVLLAKHSIFAQNLKADSASVIAENPQKEIGIITITLEEVFDEVPDSHSYTGTRYKSNYRLKFELSSEKPISSIYIDLPEYKAGWNLELRERVRAYDKELNLLQELANGTTTSESLNTKASLILQEEKESQTRGIDLNIRTGWYFAFGYLGGLGDVSNMNISGFQVEGGLVMLMSLLEAVDMEFGIGGKYNTGGEDSTADKLEDRYYSSITQVFLYLGPVIKFDRGHQAIGFGISKALYMQEHKSGGMAKNELSNDWGAYLEYQLISWSVIPFLRAEVEKFDVKAEDSDKAKEQTTASIVLGIKF